MCPLLVANLWEDILGKSEDLSLIYASKLSIHVKVLFVQGLHDGVNERREGGVVALLDDFRSCSFGVAFAGNTLEPKPIHGVFLGELVATSQHKLQLLD